jgi:hypothetical protein
MASVGVSGNRLQYGVGAGYDRRKFLAAPGTVLAVANGVIDENVWVAAYLNGRIDREFQLWHQCLGQLVPKRRRLDWRLQLGWRNRRLLPFDHQPPDRDGGGRAWTGSAAILSEDVWSAQALVGVRYSF